MSWQSKLNKANTQHDSSWINVLPQSNRQSLNRCGAEQWVPLLPHYSHCAQNKAWYRLNKTAFVSFDLSFPWQRILRRTEGKHSNRLTGLFSSLSAYLSNNIYFRRHDASVCGGMVWTNTKTYTIRLLVYNYFKCYISIPLFKRNTLISWVEKINFA